ncbi:hypothetical protein B0A55_03891 [Friedmanniomyces simplex]|uniref:F-box domain-containing protein n=1 Tax=Friedmanniomyces simplex TaxID=329884 RepID=A0A4U0XLK1_9PEZI|nr:hypothetical protein B0A55_03891 [Friedmanniomyces simplex]
MSEPESKRVKMSDGSKAPIIGTHNGHFHADEALAVFLLRLLPEYRHATLVRTRDPELLKTCTIVVDVGGVHDDGLRRYDHHQREFTATFPGKQTKLSSAGLVWMHYGRDIIRAFTGLDSKPECELLYNKIYEDFVEAFDGNDNGIAVYDPAELRKAGIEKKFNDKGFTIASIVNRYNYAPSAREGADGPTANGTTTSGAPEPQSGKSQDEEDSRFLRASAFVGEQFSLELEDRANSWLPARAIVKQAFAERTQYHPEGRIMVIPYRPEGVPWADHLHAIETEMQSEGHVLYALFAENDRPDSKWRIRAVSLEPGSFENRKGLPEAWRGVRDEELSKVSGVAGCVFVHTSGFIGGNMTFEGALEMAKKAVDQLRPEFLSTLAPELLVNILSQTSVADLKRLQRASRARRDLIAHHIDFLSKGVLEGERHRLAAAPLAMTFEPDEDLLTALVRFDKHCDVYGEYKSAISSYRGGGSKARAFVNRYLAANGLATYSTPSLVASPWTGGASALDFAIGDLFNAQLTVEQGQYTPLPDSKRASLDLFMTMHLRNVSQRTLSKAEARDLIQRVRTQLPFGRAPKNIHTAVSDDDYRLGTERIACFFARGGGPSVRPCPHARAVAGFGDAVLESLPSLPRGLKYRVREPVAMRISAQRVADGGGDAPLSEAVEAALLGATYVWTSRR